MFQALGELYAFESNESSDGTAVWRYLWVFTGVPHMQTHILHVLQTALPGDCAALKYSHTTLVDVFFPALVYTES